MKDNKVQIIIIFILFAAVNIVSFLTQDVINVKDGKGYDGDIYFSMAQNISEGNEISGPAPYIYRFGTPYLASLFNNENLLQGFFIVNFIANILSYFLLFYYLKLYLKNFSVILILLILFLTHWIGNVRYIYFLPVNADPWSLVFFLTGLILIEKIKTGYSVLKIICLSVVSFAGVMFREYLIIIPLALIFSGNPYSSGKLFYFNFKNILKKNKYFIIPLMAGILGIAVSHLLVIDTSDNYSFIRTSLRWLYTKTLINYLHSVLITIGPIIVFLIYFRKQLSEFLRQNQHIAFLFVCGILLSYIGGTDTERFIIWFMPLILLITGVMIENNLSLVKNKMFIIILIITQSLSYRIFQTILQPSDDFKNETFKYPVMTVIGNGNYFNLTSIFADKEFAFILFTEYIIVIGILFFILRKESFTK